MQTFSLTFDYRCPFARIANEQVLVGLDAGADWDVTFVPFSLGQVHVADDEAPIWDRPDDDSGLYAMQVGIAVRDLEPERFRAVHRDLFALRHDEGGNLRDRDAVRGVLECHAVDVTAVLAHVEEGNALKVVRAEHENAASDHGVWGVPTFISGHRAVFVRLMERPGDDGRAAIATVEQVLDLVDGFADLNEFKHTALPR